ncbi:MAG: Cys-rich peptide radical SAM maturase CcpM [Clostridia bacterium]
MSIVYKTFVAGNDHYVYDRNRNTILKLDETQFNALNSEHVEDACAVIEHFQEHGFLEESRLEEIENPGTRYLKELTGQQLTQLILQVTQDCNLRCSYCVYVNECYKNRKHAKRQMSFEMAKRAIDFFIPNSSGRDQVYIGFYGGEPLLRFGLIKDCIEYVKAIVSDKRVLFTMTTNGTLLNDVIIEYFIANDVALVVSLDGYKEAHNRNRIFSNGEGSFDIIMSKLCHIKNKYPDYFRSISINTVVSPETDMKYVREFYTNNELLGNLNISVATISDFYSDSPVIYDDRYLIESRYANFKAALVFAGLLDKNSMPRIYQHYVESYSKLYNALHSGFLMPKCYHHGGPCMAGTRRLFVDINGNYFPCERVSEQSLPMNIGSVETGLDKEQISALINVGRISAKECMNCWALPHCRECAAYADNLVALDKSKKLKSCVAMKDGILEDFRCLCVARDM